MTMIMTNRSECKCDDEDDYENKNAEDNGNFHDVKYDDYDDDHGNDIDDDNGNDKNVDVMMMMTVMTLLKTVTQQ